MKGSSMQYSEARAMNYEELRFRTLKAITRAARCEIDVMCWERVFVQQGEVSTLVALAALKARGRAARAATTLWHQADIMAAVLNDRACDLWEKGDRNDAEHEQYDQDAKIWGHYNTLRLGFKHGNLGRLLTSWRTLGEYSQIYGVVGRGVLLGRLRRYVSRVLRDPDQ